MPDTATQDSALAALGFKRDQPAPPKEYGLWPENWAGFVVFLRLRDQWITGMNGPIALDLASLPFWLGVEQVPQADWWQVTSDVQALANETLRLLREKK